MSRSDDIITLRFNGTDVDFETIAGIKLKNRFYALLRPVKPFKGMKESEAFVFEVTRGKNGADMFDLVTDDEIQDEVFAEYNRLLDEEIAKQGGGQGGKAARRNAGKALPKGAVLLSVIILSVLAVGGVLFGAIFVFSCVFTYWNTSSFILGIVMIVVGLFCGYQANKQRRRK